MDLRVYNISCPITENQLPQIRPHFFFSFFFQYLLHNGLSSGDSFHLFIVFNDSILAAMQKQRGQLVLTL